MILSASSRLIGSVYHYVSCAKTVEVKMIERSDPPTAMPYSGHNNDQATYPQIAVQYSTHSDNESTQRKIDCQPTCIGQVSGWLTHHSTISTKVV